MTRNRAMRRSACKVVPVGMIVLLGACADANTPAAQRGFFGGLGAALTGQDEAQSRAREQQAATAEQRLRQNQAQLAAAQSDRARTQQQVTDARARLDGLERQLDDQRARLAGLDKATLSPAAQAEASRLTRESQALDEERRRLQGGATVNRADVERLERSSRAFGTALDRLQAL